MATKSYSAVYLDMEKGEITSDYSLEFAEKTVRQGFIRKVLGLLAAQLLLTFAVAAPVVAFPAVKVFLHTNSWLLVTSMVASFVLLLVLTFSESARHTHPTNLVLLMSFTACEGLMVGAVTAQYQTHIVLQAVALTAGITAALMVYAFRTKHDFTMAGGCLMALLFTLVLTGFVGLFFRSSVMELAISGLGALLFACYIVYDIQLLAGGKHQYSISPDEYVAGAIHIYLDVLNLFLYILRLLDEINRR